MNRIPVSDRLGFFYAYDVAETQDGRLWLAVRGYGAEAGLYCATAFRGEEAIGSLGSFLLAQVEVDWTREAALDGYDIISIAPNGYILTARNGAWQVWYYRDGVWELAGIGSPPSQAHMTAYRLEYLGGSLFALPLCSGVMQSYLFAGARLVEIVNPQYYVQAFLRLREQGLVGGWGASPFGHSPGLYYPRNTTPLARLRGRWAGIRLPADDGSVPACVIDEAGIREWLVGESRNWMGWMGGGVFACGNALHAITYKSAFLYGYTGSHVGSSIYGWLGEEGLLGRWRLFTDFEPLRARDIDFVPLAARANSEMRRVWLVGLRPDRRFKVSAARPHYWVPEVPFTRAEPESSTAGKQYYKLNVVLACLSRRRMEVREIGIEAEARARPRCAAIEIHSGSETPTATPTLSALAIEAIDVAAPESPAVHSLAAEADNTAKIRVAAHAIEAATDTADSSPAVHSFATEATAYMAALSGDEEVLVTQPISYPNIRAVRLTTSWPPSEERLLRCGYRADAEALPPDDVTTYTPLPLRHFALLDAPAQVVRFIVIKPKATAKPDIHIQVNAEQEE